MDNSLAIKNVDEMMPTVEVLQKLKMVCDYYVAAKLLPPGYKDGSDLMVIGIRARELGVSLGQAVGGMFPMKGRIGYMGGFLSSLVAKNLPNSDIRIKTSTKEVCVLEWRKSKDEEYQTEEFSMEEVIACNYHQSPIYGSDGNQKTDSSGHLLWKPKGPWGDTKNMLYWRCLTRVINRHFSTVFGSAVYTADEIQDMDAIDVPATNKASTASESIYKPIEKPPVTILKVVDPLPPTVTEIEEAVIVSKQEDQQPEPPQEPAGIEPVASSKMNQKTIDLLVSQFEKDIYQAKDKRSVDDVFDTFKKTGVPGKVLTNCFNIKNQRKAELK